MQLDHPAPAEGPLTISRFLSSLRARLLFVVLLVAFFPFSFSLRELIEERQKAEQEAVGAAQRIARRISREHERLIESGRHLLVGITQIPQILTHDSVGCSNLFSNLLKSYQSFTNIGAVKPNGDLFCSALPFSEPVNLADRPYFQRALETKDFTVSEYLIGRVSGKAALILAFPSLDSRGQVRAVVFLGLDLAWTNRELTGTRLPDGATVVIVDRSGLILNRHPDPQNWIGRSAANEPIVKTVLARREGTTEAAGLDGIKRLYYFTAIRGIPDARSVFVWVSIPKDVVLAEVRRAFAWDLAQLGIIVLLGLTLAWTGTDIFVLRRVNALVKATKELAAGDLRARTGLPHKEDELGQLAYSFDQMAESLEQNITERKLAEEKAQRNLERIQALHEIDRAITSILDLRAILDALLEKMDLVLPYAATAVRLFNKESGLLEPVACRNLDEGEWKAERWRGGRGIPNAVFETKALVTISNVQIDPQNRDQEFFRKHGLVSYLGVPLIAKGEILGVISFYTKEEHEFNNEEIEFLTTLAEQAAIAIHNSQVHEEMTKLVGDLAKSNRVKDEFLSVMSHELRTPLNVVMGYTGMIQDGMLGEINPQQKEALGKVTNRANDLLAMVNDILYATALEAEKIKIESLEVNLEDFLNQLRSGYEAPINKELTLSWDYPSDLPLIKTDSGKLKQILKNLIDNAIKFTDKGSVTISARIRHEATGRTYNSRLSPHALESWVEFKVTDTGLGIPKEHLSAIFDKFRQVDSSETRLYGGVGMGLYVVKKFTEMLGGKVEVESQPGKGSTFTVTIPPEQ